MFAGRGHVNFNLVKVILNFSNSIFIRIRHRPNPPCAYNLTTFVKEILSYGTVQDDQTLSCIQDDQTLSRDEFDILR